MEIKDVEILTNKLRESFQMLVDEIGQIPIGRVEQFPYGWRKAAKGRTVWRIVEEVINQNLEKYYKKFGLEEVHSSDSEVSVYDVKCKFSGLPAAYINIKSAVEGGRKNKDDISKAHGLASFYEEDEQRQFFVATFFIKFNSNMSIEIDKVVVFPITWIPDIYVNPSNNGNLQSAYYKDISYAVKRTNVEFVKLFHKAISVAEEKRKRKRQV